MRCKSPSQATRCNGAVVDEEQRCGKRRERRGMRERTRRTMSKSESALSKPERCDASPNYQIRCAWSAEIRCNSLTGHSRLRPRRPAGLLQRVAARCLLPNAPVPSTSCMAPVRWSHGCQSALTREKGGAQQRDAFSRIRAASR